VCQAPSAHSRGIVHWAGPELARQIAGLFADLQALLGVAYLLISHDLALVGEIADEIAVMEAGRIFEHAPAASLASSAKHPVTRELLAAPRTLEGGAACPLWGTLQLRFSLPSERELGPHF